MASWLKAAEDLFEVVDRRAKLVVSEYADEQSDSKSPASSGQGSQGKRTKSKSKAQKGQAVPSPVISDTTKEQGGVSEDSVDVTSPSNKFDSTKVQKGPSILSPVINDITKEQVGTPAEPVDVATVSEKVDLNLVAENDGSASMSTSQAKKEQPATDKMPPLSGTPSTEVITNDVNKHEMDNVEVLVDDNNAGPSTLSETISTDVQLPKENASDIHDGHSSPSNKGIESPSENQSTDTGLIMDPGNMDADLKKGQERSESLTSDTASNGDVLCKDTDLIVQSIDNGKSQEDHKTETDNSKKVQDQLDEAQGLLKTAKSTGQSKEARLARVCAGLSSRLQEYKAENAQLEELLSAERELSKSYEGRMKELQKDLSECKREVSRVESNMSDALAAKNAEIDTLVSSMDAVKRQAALSEGNLASLQASMESMIRSRELTETRMMQALREELASAERRAEEERAAHNATKMSAMEREVELEHRAVEASTALARIQRIADERTAKATELEQKVALLEVECASLNQELQDMETRARREQKKSPEETNQVIQIQAWQEEVERARQGQRDAENKLSSLEAELQKMRVEMAAMKRDAEHYSRQEHMELEKRYRELTDLLYYKQTQLETMASEKAATEFQLEKEIKRIQEAQVEAE
ncbi:golgin candidate 1-like, partial [Prosopis cineraria]|uniref:golgin candidate 1-like n=1 Tax=Prosopis cineraria TaxID=364024 RepID=UPI0024101323